MRYAVITYHPNGIEDRLLVHSWHPTADDADAASVRLAMEFSETIDGKNVIPPSMAGLAIVAEDELLELVPGQEWTWTPRPVEDVWETPEEARARRLSPPSE